MDLAATAGLGEHRTKDTTSVGVLRIPSAETWGAGAVLLSVVVSLIGASWDIQWHSDVGPDTFFTLPHLFLYAGSAGAGVGSLAMVLRATAAQRAGRQIRALGGGPLVRIFGGIFTAPIGYVVCGIGAALFLVYGLLDLSWHSIYGFDVVLNSPPHTALFLSNCITLTGAVIVFAASDRLWGAVGLATTAAIFMTVLPLLASAARPLPLPNAVLMVTVFFMTLLLVSAAGAMRRPAAAVMIAVALGIVQGALWAFTPWATEAYAGMVGLPLRDGLPAHPPGVPARIPIFMLLAAVLVDAVRWYSRRTHPVPRWLAPAMGAGAGLVLAVTLLAQPVLLGITHLRPSAGTLVTVAVGGVIAGALAGFLGRRCALLLRPPTGSS